MDTDGEQKPLLHTSIITPYHINSIDIAHSPNYTTCNIYNINTGNTSTEYKLYWRRYWILLLFSLLSAVQSVVWITYGAVADTSQEFYQKSAGQINFLAGLGPIAFLPMAPITAWAIGEYGLRTTSVAGAMMCTVGAVIRCFATPDTFWIVIIAQFLNAAAGPVVMSAPPALSAAWFGVNERTFATAVSSMANNLGTALSFAFGFFITNGKQLQFLLYVEGIFAVVLLMGFLIYFPNVPPTPPSASASVKKPILSLGASFSSLWKDSWGVVTQKDGLILVLVGGLTPGVFSGWGALCVTILGPLGFGQLQAQWISFASTISGLSGGIFAGYVHDRFKHFKIMLVFLFAASSATFAVFTLATSGYWKFTFLEILIVSTIGGTFINSLYPIAFEGLVEVTFPVKEEVSVNLNTALNNLACLAFLMIGTTGANIPPTVMNWILVGTCLAAAIGMIFVREEYRRSKIDMKAP